MLTALASQIDRIVLLLDRVEEKHWSAWLRRDAAALRAGDRRALQHFLSAFGGMGSLNDLYLCPENRHRISPGEVKAVNSELSKLIDDAWQVARALSGKSDR